MRHVTYSRVRFFLDMAAEALVLFPDRVHAIYIYPASNVVQTLFTMIKPALPARIRNKVALFTDAEEMRARLGELKAREIRNESDAD